MRGGRTGRQGALFCFREFVFCFSFFKKKARFTAEVTISKQDILRALGSGAFMDGEMVDDSQPSDEARGKIGEPHVGSQGIDDLFKRPQDKFNQKSGTLKVRFLGNALKDYQLIRPADDGARLCAEAAPSTPSQAGSGFINEPTFVYFQKAKAALQAACQCLVSCHVW